MSMGKTTSSLVVLLAMAGCSLPGARTQAISYHVLQAPASAQESASALSTQVISPDTRRPLLLLRDSEASVFAQNPRLVYSRAAGTRAYYQYAFWTEAPPKQLQTLLRQRLLASGLYAGVVPLASGVRGDLQLNFRLLDFFHDAATTPGVARIRLEAELIERDDARLIAQRSFEAQAPLASQDAASAAVALGQASAQALDQLVVWLTEIQASSVDVAQAR
jgi:cholesterol transport system auxiliary component